MRMTRWSHYVLKDQFRIWSFRRKCRNPFAGLEFWKRDSGGRLIIASRHWPHEMCWSWLLSWRGGHWRFHRSSGGPCGWVKAGPLSLDWQSYDMVAPGHEAEFAAFVELEGWHD